MDRRTFISTVGVAGFAKGEVKKEHLIEEKENPPTNIIRHWQIGEGLVVKRDEFMKVAKMIGDLRTHQKENGGDLDVATGHALSCEVIPWGQGIDALLGLIESADEEEEPKIHLTIFTS